MFCRVRLWRSQACLDKYRTLSQELQDAIAAGGTDVSADIKAAGGRAAGEYGCVPASGSADGGGGQRTPIPSEMVRTAVSILAIAM